MLTNFASSRNSHLEAVVKSVVAGSHADHKVGFLRQVVRRLTAGDADAAQIHRMRPLDGGFSRLRLSKRDLEPLRERAERAVRLGITHAAAADQDGFFRCTDGLRGLCHRFARRRAALDPMDALLKEAHGVVVSFALDILRQRDAHRASVGGVSQHPERARHRAHQLIGPVHAVKIPAHRAERVVGGEPQVVRLLDLLQHRVGLAAGVHVAGQEQNRDVVGGGGSCGGHHVGRAGADGRGDRENLLTLYLLGKRDRRVGHALLVLALIEFEGSPLLLKRLTKADHIPVAGQHHDAAHKALFLPVKAHVLVFQKAHQRLRHRKPNRFHGLFSSSVKIWSLALSFHSHACAGSSMRVFCHGLPGRCRMPHT